MRNDFRFCHPLRPASHDHGMREHFDFCHPSPFISTFT
jgi:hypothetical protein